MKHYFFKKSLLLAFLSLVLVSGTVGATVTIENPLGSNTLQDFLYRVLDFVFWLAIAIAPIMIIIGGFYFLTAQGDPAKITTAKQIILYALIGLVIIVSAKGLVQLFQQIF